MNPQEKMNRAAPKVGVFHPGTQHSWQTALGFQETGQLQWYATSVFYDPGRWPYRLERLVPPPLSTRLHRDFTRRYLPALQPRLVRQFGLWEWIETAARRCGQERLAQWANHRGNASFGEMVIRLAEREPVDVLWGYNTSSVEVFRWAKRRGIVCVLDQTIGHCASMNRVMLAEQARHPDFFLESYTPFSADEIAQQQEEISLADVVVVGSDYCAQTLVENGCDRKKLRVVPYGFDETLFPAERPRRPPLGGRPLECLFVGSIQPRKGIASLLHAFAEIAPEQARLTLVGRLEIPSPTFERFRRRVAHVDSLPRSEVVKHFLAADCFLFPSLFEGGGIVLYEACAAGLGIIQSAHCGDGVRDGRNGQVLAEVSATALHRAIAALADAPRQLAGWQEASWQMRLERTWQRYRQNIRTLISP
jgi:glycosyltransferase involved in cell wall biosynthesis